MLSTDHHFIVHATTEQRTVGQLCSMAGGLTGGGQRRLSHIGVVSKALGQALQPQLRQLLHYHSGVRVFQTRQLMLDMQAIARPRTPSDLSPS